MFHKAIRNLGFWIFVAMILGIATGIAFGSHASIFAPIGNLFMQLIKMMVVPLVAISIISGAAALGATKSSGKIGIATIAYIFGTTAIAVIIALIFGTLLKPGAGFDAETVKEMFSTTTTMAKPQSQGFWGTVMSIIPTNPFQSLVDGNILQIIFFGILLGIGISTLPDGSKTPLVNILNGILNALIWGIKMVMYIAPFGVFGLMANAVGSFGGGLLINFVQLLWVNVVADIVVFFGLYPLTLKLFSKINLIQFYGAMLRPQIVAFSTSSSLATLPVNMETAETKLGVSKATTSFVLPLGATINMTGTAVYYVLTALFFAQLYNIPLGMSQYVAIGLASTAGSIGQAGTPGPTLLVVAILLAAGIPLDGLPILYAFDQIFNMLRTTVNITGDAACAVIVDRIGKTGNSA